MTWLEHHKTSEYYAQLAEDAVRQQDFQLAQTLYAQAAQAEHLALNAIPVSGGSANDRTKTKTLGITVISAVALSLKANQFRQAEQTAYQWLATDLLPTFAIPSLRELLLDIWQQQPLAQSPETGIEPTILVR
jgi:hypothetical protein